MSSTGLLSLSYEHKKNYQVLELFYSISSVVEYYYCTLHKEMKLSLRISSVNVTKFAGNCGFGHIYWRNP